MKKTIYRKYYVITPSYCVFSQTEIEPAEYGQDYIEVKASSRKKAIIKATKLWTDLYKPKYGNEFYVVQQRLDDCCPFIGIKAYTYEELRKNKWLILTKT